MSASRDPSQKLAFIYSNLYKMYKDEKVTNESGKPSSVIKGSIIGTAQGLRPGLRIHTYKPMELLQNKKKESEKKLVSPTVTMEGLKKSLNELESLHHKLHFMLADLEEFLKKK